MASIPLFLCCHCGTTGFEQVDRGHKCKAHCWHVFTWKSQRVIPTHDKTFAKKMKRQYAQLVHTSY